MLLIFTITLSARADKEVVKQNKYDCGITNSIVILKYINLEEK